MFTKFKEMSVRRRIADIQARVTGESLFVKEFTEINGRPPKEVECMQEIDRLQKLVAKGVRR